MSNVSLINDLSEHDGTYLIRGVVIKPALKHCCNTYLAEIFMKRTILAALLSMIAIHAQADEWKKLNPSVYFLDSAEQSKVMAIANLNGDKLIVNLLDINGIRCKDGEDRAISPIGPYKVNKTNVKFVDACINGNRIISPETQPGKEFFAKALTSGPASVEMDMGIVLHFSSENFDSVRQAMIDSRSAL